jgi:UDP-GlcNAc:undecaprenyl-phosphate/decaprenyl-phosphate GlcNAc-1-phosphate transferase
VSSLAFPVLLMLIPLFDTAFVTLSRKLSARKASVGGRDHTSHRLVALGFPESRAVLMLYGFAACGGATAVALSRSSFQEASVLTGVLLIGLMLLGVRLARVKTYGGRDFELLRDRRFTPLLVDFTYKRRVFELLLDLLLAGLAYYAAHVIRFGDDFSGLYINLFVRSLPVVMACELAGLYVGGVYQGIWRYFTVSDLIPYAKGFLLGTIGTLLTLVYLYRFESYSRGVFLINLLIFGLLVVGSRLSFRGLAELANRYSTSGEPTLIYGAGDGGTLLARELRNNRKHLYRPVGFIDDDLAKQGRRILGLSVLGTGADLEELIGRHSVTIVVVSTPLEPNRFSALRLVCHRSGTALKQLQFQFSDLLTIDEAEYH